MPDGRLPTDAPADALIALYARADAQIRHLVRAAAARGAAGTAGYFARQRRSVAQVQRELQARTPAMAAAAVEVPHDAAWVATGRALGVEPGFAGVDRRQVDVLVAALTGGLQGAVRTVGRSADDVFRRLALEEVAAGVARGDRRSTPARLRQRLADEGTTAFVDRANRRWRLEVYARMATRTMSREAHTVATVQRMRALGSDLAAVSDHRTRTELCERFEGRTYSLSGLHPQYPRLPLAPPFHPNCKHVLRPAAASFEEFERELAAAAP